jgi:hypothetical protein
MHYFLTYNDGTHIAHMEKLIESVKKHGKQFEIIVFNKSDIDLEFSETNKRILELRRGGGYWLWKPYIINETLKKLNDGDILFYFDSMYYFTENFDDLYKPLLEINDIVVWKNKPNDGTYYMKNWCKMDIIQKYGMYEKVFIDNVNDCWAGAICIKKTENNSKIMKFWLEACTSDMDITDRPSNLANSPDFIEHRHDQSMLSIALHKNDVPLHLLKNRCVFNVRQPY